MIKSYEVMASGGEDLWDKMKEASQKIVRVCTDDTEFTIAHLIRQSAKEVRIATMSMARGRPKCQVVNIDRNRITKFVELN